MSDAPQPTTGLAKAGRVMIAYEEFGKQTDEAILLIMGLGMQLTAWDDEFCLMLANRGYHVIRFDNRDCGLSSKVGGKRRANLIAGAVGITTTAAYTLEDMAADTVALLDQLSIDRAHLVGASMGGMIGQTVAAHYPERVLSLTSIMAGTGKRKISTIPRLGVLPVLFKEPAGSREDFIEDTVAVFSKIGSEDYPQSEERLRKRAADAFDRCFYPEGTARQLMAVMASGNRTEDIARITAPTQVIHGTDDPLVPVRAGKDVAKAIPGAKLELIEGMGHDLPPALFERIADLIVANAREARTLTHV